MCFCFHNIDIVYIQFLDLEIEDIVTFNIKSIFQRHLFFFLHANHDGYHCVELDCYETITVAATELCINK